MWRLGIFSWSLTFSLSKKEILSSEDFDFVAHASLIKTAYEKARDTKEKKEEWQEKQSKYKPKYLVVSRGPQTTQLFKAHSFQRRLKT